MDFAIEAERLEADGSWTSLSLQPGEGPHSGFREQGEVRFRNRFGAGWGLRVDEAPLPIGQVAAETWHWTPGFYAGEVHVELTRPDGSVAAAYRMDVAPDASKTGREAFHAMLDDIWAFDPSLVLGTEPSTTPIGSLGQMQDLLVAYGRLRRFGPDLLRALEAVRRRPIRALSGARAEVRLHEVRRVDRQTAYRALRDPALSSLLAGDWQTQTAAIGPNHRLDVPRVEETFDCAANRCLARAVRFVWVRARQLRERLKETVEKEQDSATRTALRERWPARRQFLERLERSLASVLSRSPFREVTRFETTAAGLNAVSAHPDYGRAYRLAWRALRLGVEGEANDEWAWLSPTWEIYERWCFVQLVQLFRERRPDVDWRAEKKGKTAADVAWVGSGQAGEIRVLFQPRFSGGASGNEPGMRSISKRRVPDIVVVHSWDGQEKFWVFDAKYRVSESNVKDAMSSAHIYQDSLRWNGRRPVQSILLVPRGGGASWLEEDAFVSAHRVGVFELSPSATREGLANLWNSWLASSTELRAL